MSQARIAPGPAEEYPDDSELISDDGVPLETSWHRAAIGLLIESLGCGWRDRDDFYVGGNMFIYFSAQQARNRDYRGPDFFVVMGAPRQPPRPYWAVWHEGHRYPDLIVELTSPSTADEDRTTKKAIYERTFRTRDYFCYDPDTNTIEGWTLDDAGRYQPNVADDQGRHWCESVGLYLVQWLGAYAEIPGPALWPRFATPDGVLVPTWGELERSRADAEQQRADAERQRADAAEAELARLRALLGGSSGNGPGA